MKNIILFGQKNSGKSFIGKKLAKSLNFEFIDTDLLIEKRYFELTNKTVSLKDIFKKEKYFRALEKKVIFSLKKTEKSVISLGGGSLLDKENIKFLKKIGFFIYLKIDKKTFFNRTKKNPYNSILEEIYEKREKIFNKIDSIIIDTNKLTQKEILKKILCQIPLEQFLK
ncbi:MAG: hypothetical protein AMS24_04525 [Chlamydiae bacterium SM23_39]|nr:MAG: hypothetical protein AMS24_04525 [Chlamydiae bacterium SM23_39]